MNQLDVGPDRGRLRTADPGPTQRRRRRHPHKTNETFVKVKRWLGATLAARTPTPKAGRNERQDVAQLGQRLLDRMRDDGLRRRTLEDYERIIRCHVVPVIGDVSIVEWDPEHSRNVLRRARQAGRAPATIQDIGAVMVAMIREAHRRPRWLAPDENPMEDVRFRARARHQGQATVFIPPSERPSTPEVRLLCAALYWRGHSRGRPWYLLMGLLAGFGGLRWSELIGLRPRDYDATRRKIVVATSIEQPDSGVLVRETTKNNKVREVPITGTIHRRFVQHCDHVAASDVGEGVWPLGGEDGLLFPGAAGAPWDRSVWRRGVFIPSARAAGWEMVGDAPTSTGLLRGGRPRLPWRNLRHHAATWLHHEAGLPWEEVSHILGHHNVAFTMATYVRRGSDSEDEVRSRLDRL